MTVRPNSAPCTNNSCAGLRKELTELQATVEKHEATIAEQQEQLDTLMGERAGLVLRGVVTTTEATVIDEWRKSQPAAEAVVDGQKQTSIFRCARSSTRSLEMTC